jgi:hypothetical protein
MKTAMQQHIEWLKATLDICKENAPTLVNCINLCISDSESRLGMEKEQISIAYKEGWNCPHGEGFPETGEQYYKETYESKTNI